MGLSAAYCSEIALSNPKRFVTVKNESTENRRRCSTKKIKITPHISTEQKKKDIPVLKKIHKTGIDRRLLGPE